MESKAVLQQRLTLLKQHHDELNKFFQQIQVDVDSTYRNYKGTAIAADVIADLALLSIAAYRSCLVASTALSKLAFARQALQFAYGPIKTVLTDLGSSHPNAAAAERQLSGVPNLLMSVANIVGNATAPSYWAGVVSNIKSGHFKTAFTRDPATQITQIQSSLKRQRAEALEMMERQINQMEKELGVNPTMYICAR